MTLPRTPSQFAATIGSIFPLAKVHRTGGWAGVENAICVGQLQGPEVLLACNPAATDLRRESAGLCAARLASTSEDLVVQFTKQLITSESFVADGRTASQIFPGADLHFHVTCSEGESLSRRLAEGEDADTFLLRQKIDAARVKPNENTQVIDTGGKTPRESLDEILDRIKSWRSPGAPPSKT